MSITKENEHRWLKTIHLNKNMKRFLQPYTFENNQINKQVKSHFSRRWGERWGLNTLPKKIVRIFLDRNVFNK